MYEQMFPKIVYLPILLLVEFTTSHTFITLFLTLDGDFIKTSLSNNYSLSCDNYY